MRYAVPKYYCRYLCALDSISYLQVLHCLGYICAHALGLVPVCRAAATTTEWTISHVWQGARWAGTLHIHKFRSGAALSNGPFGASSRPRTPPATFDSRLILTNDLASQIVICLVPHQGVSRFRASIQASAVSGPLVTALVGLVWGCFGVSVPLLPFNLTGSC